MATIVNEIELSGVKYVRKDVKKSEFIGMYVVIRTFSAGVHIGTLQYHEGKEVVLSDSIRIWKWAGAASLSQLAVEGTKSKNDCKFSLTVPKILLTEAIEIIPITKEAEENLKSVKQWKI